MPREHCPHCGDFLLAPHGPLNTNILIVGDAPDWLDVMVGSPFSSQDKNLRAGDIIRQELTRASINPARVRFTNLWVHAKKKVGECERGFHITILLQELMKVEFALISGTEPLQVLLGEGVSASERSGLIIKSKELPQNVTAMAAVKISTGFDMLGEVRLAVERFAEVVHNG